MLALATIPPDEALEQELTQLTARGDLDAALARARIAGARACVLSAEPAEPGDDATAEGAGFTLTRELLQLRRALPIAEQTDLDVRPFRVGVDDNAWLDLNNRAFAWHPEQGGWSIEDLRAKLAEPWFDSSGFLMHEVDGRLAGFCWTKIHRETDPPMGEIFVIAVDPARTERGMGRRLTVAGLEWLSDQGLRVAMLYVEADNAAARALYDRLGFTTHHSKRWWRIDFDLA